MKTKILVVEDEAIIGMDIRNTLLRLGYEVPSVVISGEEAITKVDQYQPQLILMDIQLKKGGIDGIEASKIIQEKWQIPIVFLTAHSDSKTLERSKSTNLFGYIIKPFDEKDLYTTIEIALARAKAESEMRKAWAKEKELNELKSRFVSTVSHEFRTPLSTIALSTGLLEKYKSKWDEPKKQVHFQRIQSSIKQMTNLLDDVLTIGQIESGNMPFNPTPINLTQFLGQMLEEKQDLDQNLHPITYQIEGELSQICIDEKLFRHIFSNLLSNAIKYSPLGTEIKVKLTYSEHQVSITVSDQGIGIPPQDQQRLFEMFYRAENVGTIQGTGVGLSIVKRAVEMHGGQITVDSEVNQGTTFIVQIPLPDQNPDLLSP